MPYLFQDTDLAARRLAVLAEVFAPASRAFLLDVVQSRPELALDLGCGPGYTTRLLAEVTLYHHPVSTRQAATMFSLNIPAWQRQPFIQEHYKPDEIGQLEYALCELAEHATAENEIEWGMRQVAYEHV